jgi:hypothetical protein
MIDKWSQYSTPNGPLLDNAFMLWTSHVASGPSHSFSNVPIIIAGSPGGYLKQGQYLVVGTGNSLVTNNKLHNTLGTAIGCTNGGAPLDNFGPSGLSGGQVDAIIA